MKPDLTPKSGFLTIKPSFMGELAPELDSEIWVKLVHPENAGRGTVGRGNSVSQASKQETSSWAEDTVRRSSVWPKL